MRRHKNTANIFLIVTYYTKIICRFKRKSYKINQIKVNGFVYGNNKTNSH